MWGWLRRPVRHPELWGINLHCLQCGWRTGPDGPWTVADCLNWPQQCPDCRQSLILVVPPCPSCGSMPWGEAQSPEVKVARLMRWPRTLDEALWGHFRCRACGRAYDKWGRPVVADAPPG